MRCKLPKRGDKPSLIARFNVEPIVIFDLMSNADTESAGHPPQPPDAGDLIPRNLFPLPKLVKKKTLGTKVPIDRSCSDRRGKRSNKKKGSANLSREARWTIPTKNL
jgi:hypothetical protein